MQVIYEPGDMISTEDNLMMIVGIEKNHPARAGEPVYWCISIDGGGMAWIFEEALQDSNYIGHINLDCLRKQIDYGVRK